MSQTDAGTTGSGATAPAPEFSQGSGTLTDVAHRLTFTGKGSEYFGIWIVNLLLTIITLGVYSAWAKVRRLQYFYRNTQLAGASFDYHGSPVAILKGRLIALAMFAAYNLAGAFNPILGLFVALLLIALLPRLLLKSLQFRLHNSSYRGLRFRFNGSLKQSYVVFLLLPLASLLTFYLLAPFCHQRIKRFQHNHAAFGQTSFTFSVPVRSFYGLYLKLLGVVLLGVAVLAVGISAFFGGQFLLANGKMDPQAMVMLPLLMAVGFFLLFFFVRPFLEAQLQNLVWNHTRLGEHRFVSTISALRLFGIMLTNLLGIVLTLGLYRPFAVIRLLKYRLQTLTLVAAGDLEGFLASHGGAVAAVGDETAEMFDIDIAL